MDHTALFFVFTLLGCSTIVVQCTPKNIFILAGQSNMVGEGGVNISKPVWDGIIPPDCRSNPQILRLNNDSLWETAREPLHQGIGSEMISGIFVQSEFAAVSKRPAQGSWLPLSPFHSGGLGNRR